MEELKNINIVIRWGKNGQKYVWESPTQKKISQLIKKYGVEKEYKGCLWLK